MHLSPPPPLSYAARALSRQRSTLAERLAAQRPALEHLAFNARATLVPLSTVARFLSREAYASGYPYSPEALLGMLTEREGQRGLNPSALRPKKHQKHFLLYHRWLSLRGRRAPEAELYADLDDGFARFVLGDAAARAEVEAAYAAKNRFLVPLLRAPELEREIEGWNTDVVLRRVQREEITRLLDLGEGISAADVGVGKTLIGVGIALQGLAQKRFRRPLLVCPTAVLGKWRRALLEACPTAQVRVIGSEPVWADAECSVPATNASGEELWQDLSDAESVQRHLYALTGGDFDLALISTPTLSRIPLGETRLLELIEAEFAAQLSEAPFSRAHQMSPQLFETYVRLKAQALLGAGEITLETLEGASAALEAVNVSIEALQARDAHEARDAELRTRKEERERHSFFARAARLLARDRSSRVPVPFETLGFDALIVDELHNYKALLPLTDYGDVKYLGADDGASERAVDLYYKARDLQLRSGGPGFFGLTATPMVNSPLDLFCLLYYLHHSPLEDVGVHTTGQFLARYGDIREELTYTVSGEVRTQQVFKGFMHLGELRSVVARALRRVGAREAGLTVPQPTLEYLLYAPDPVQEEILYGILDNPVEAMRRYGGHSEIPEDLDPDSEEYSAFERRLFLACMHLLLRAELDLEMIDPTLYRGHVSPKVRGCLEDIAVRLEAGEKVVLFCDLKDMPSTLGKKNPHGYSFHDKLARLISERCGLDPARVGIINASATPSGEDRLAVCDALRDGRLSVVIGNVAMGEGVDLQWGVSTLLNLDIPYNVARLEQRIGRIVRPGNTYEQVSIRFHMGTLGLDPHMLDVVWGKRGWYDRFWNGEDDRIETPLQEAMPSRARIQALRVRDPEAREAALEALREADRARQALGERKMAATLVKKLQDCSVSLGALPGRAKMGLISPGQFAREHERLSGELARHTARLSTHPGFQSHAALLEGGKPFCFDPAEDQLYHAGLEGDWQRSSSLPVLEVEIVAVDLAQRTLSLRPLNYDGRGSDVERVPFYEVLGGTLKVFDPLERFEQHVTRQGGDYALLRCARERLEHLSEAEAGPWRAAFVRGFEAHARAASESRYVLDGDTLRLTEPDRPGTLLSPLDPALLERGAAILRGDPDLLVALTGEATVQGALQSLRSWRGGALVQALRRQGVVIACDDTLASLRLKVYGA